MPPNGHDLTDVPPDLDQTFSAVRQALGELQQSASLFGYFAPSWTATPKETVETFYKQDPEGNLNRIFSRLIPQAPAIKQADKLIRPIAQAHELVGRRVAHHVPALTAMELPRDLRSWPQANLQTRHAVPGL